MTRAPLPRHRNGGIDWHHPDVATRLQVYLRQGRSARYIADRLGINVHSVHHGIQRLSLSLPPAGEVSLPEVAAALSLRPALHWVGGNALTAQFPQAFEGERLAKTCAWLRGLRSEQLEPARTQMLAALHQLWPAYQEACSVVPETNGLGTDNEYRERVWNFVDRVDSLWVDPSPGRLNQPAPYLPEFRDTECGRVSYSFHLTLLALVTLNRQTGRPLLAFELEMN